MIAPPAAMAAAWAVRVSMFLRDVSMSLLLI
jgi:hypothetical protein